MTPEDRRHTQHHPRPAYRDERTSEDFGDVNYVSRSPFHLLLNIHRPAISMRQMSGAYDGSALEVDKDEGKEMYQHGQDYLGMNSDSRGSSQVTLSEESWLQKGLRPHLEYVHQESMWSFHRQGELEPSHGTFPSGKHIKWTGVSYCAQIGTLRLERLVMLSSDQSRRPAERLNVNHIADPLSDGNTPPRPSMLVHKHSRAKAFAMYRFYGLHTRRDRHDPSTRSNSQMGVSGTASTQSRIRHQSGSGGPASLPLSRGILLAPKSLLPQFTNTHNTRNLADHGMLDQPRSSSPGPHAQDTHRSTTLGDTTASITSENARLARPQAPGSAETVPFTVAQPNIRCQANSVDESEEEDVGHQHYNPRRTYAEMYGTLDQPTLERLRPFGGSQNDHSRNSLWPLRRFRGSPASRAQVHGAGAVSTRPPWLMLASPGRKEHTRAVKHLDSSLGYHDMGSVPTVADGASSGPVGIRQENEKHADVFERVPDDAMCMILPLWPAETDSTNMQMLPDELSQSPSLEERRYLLVYLVNVVDDTEGGRGRDASERGEKKWPRIIGKGRKREQSSSATIVFDSFKASARMVSYDDLKGSNVRLPDHGLSVTGPLPEAQRGIPPAPVRDVNEQDYMIAVCINRHKGDIALSPEGLEKLGLCTRDAGHVLSTQSEKQGEVIVAQEPPPSLTAIGRAVAEMTWLACMSLTSFEDV